MGEITGGVECKRANPLPGLPNTNRAIERNNRLPLQDFIIGVGEELKFHSRSWSSAAENAQHTYIRARDPSTTSVGGRAVMVEGKRTPGPYQKGQRNRACPSVHPRGLLNGTSNHLWASDSKTSTRRSGSFIRTHNAGLPAQTRARRII